MVRHTKFLRVPRDLSTIHGLPNGHQGLRAKQRDKVYLQQTKFLRRAIEAARGEWRVVTAPARTGPSFAPRWPRAGGPSRPHLPRPPPAQPRPSPELLHRLVGQREQGAPFLQKQSGVERKGVARHGRWKRTSQAASGGASTLGSRPETSKLASCACSNIWVPT